MSGWDDVVTYEQLQAMTPEERSRRFRASIVGPGTPQAAERDHLAAMTARLNERTRSRERHLRGQAS